MNFTNLKMTLRHETSIHFVLKHRSVLFKRAGDCDQQKPLERSFISSQLIHPFSSYLSPFPKKVLFYAGIILSRGINPLQF